MVRIICLLIGYAFGLFQTSYIYGRTKGIDIREHGSGNAGTTNALRTLGKKAGAITLAGDCIKCILAVLTVPLIFGASHPEMLKLLTVYAAAGTILGHNFALFFSLRRGKGIAATAGLIISFDWRITLVCAALFFLNLAVTHYVSLGSMMVYVVFFAMAVIMGQAGCFALEPPYLYEMYVVIALLAVLAALGLALRKRLKVLGAQLKSGHLSLEQLLIALAVFALFTTSLLVGQKRAVEVRRSALCRQVHQRCAFPRSILRLAGSAPPGILGAARRDGLVRQVVGSHAHRRQRH